MRMPPKLGRMQIPSKGEKGFNKDYVFKDNRHLRRHHQRRFNEDGDVDFEVTPTSALHKALQNLSFRMCLAAVVQTCKHQRETRQRVMFAIALRVCIINSQNDEYGHAVAGVVKHKLEEIV